MQAQATQRQSVPFLRLPRHISSYWLGNLSPSCSSLLLAISENTLGWQKESDLISNYQLKKLTGLSEKTIVRARKKLVELGLITYAESYSKRGDRQANRYGICIERISQKNAPNISLKAKKMSLPPPPNLGGTIDRENKERVNDCACARGEQQKENGSLTRNEERRTEENDLQRLLDEQLSLEIACESGEQENTATQEVSLEELEMQRMLDEHLTKLEQEPFEQVVDEIERESVATLPAVVPPIKEFRAVAPPAHKRSLSIVSSKSQIADAFSAYTVVPKNHTGRRLPVEAHIAKFNQKQLESLSFLESIQTGADYKTNAWLARNYSLYRLKEVYAEAVRRKAKSIIAYMQTLLKKGSVVMNGRIETNALFAKKFREEQKWYDLHINAKHAVFEFCGMREEMEFNMPVEQFSGYMQRKHALYQSNCRR